jgi:hypothetical protein
LESEIQKMGADDDAGDDIKRKTKKHKPHTID